MCAVKHSKCSDGCYACVKSRLDQAGRLARDYRATGVPCLIVNGKYRIEGRMAGTFENMLKIAEYLVEQERQAKQG